VIQGDDYGKNFMGWFHGFKRKHKGTGSGKGVTVNRKELVPGFQPFVTNYAKLKHKNMAERKPHS